VALPCSPTLARCASLCPELGERAPPGLKPGDLLHILGGGSPDGSLLFAVVASTSIGGSGVPACEGWVKGDQIQVLSSEDIAQLQEVPRLSTREVLRRTTLARAAEDWQDPEDEPSCLALRSGEMLQLLTVRGNWAFAWPLDAPSRRGWVPLAFVQIVESSVGTLLQREPQEISPSASAALLALVQQAAAVSTPPRRPPAWIGELPAVVAESAKQEEHAFRELLAESDAAAAAAAAAASQDAGLTDKLGEGDGDIELLDGEDLPEECYPLVVCTASFVPSRNPGEALLQLEAGDLVRVTSPLDAAMYHGFRRGDARQRGWFPQRSVKLLEDPLSEEADNLPVQIGLPPLPQVSEEVLRVSRA